MQDFELISAIKGLKEVKPNKEWVVLSKNRIFGVREEAKPSVGFIFWAPRLAWAPIISVFIVIGLFGFAQSAVPGNLFFPFKKITESGEVWLSLGAEKPKTQLKLANRRLEELGEIAGANDIRNLKPAIEEFQASLVQATKNLRELPKGALGSDSLSLKEIAIETQKLEIAKQNIETVLGAVVGDTGELESALAKLVERELKDLEKRTLTDGQSQLFEQARETYLEGDYTQALEKIWQISNNK